MSKRIKLTVAYDGTAYCGWQIQPNGITIEEVLNRTLTDFLGEEIRVIGASRTDSGVHARGNVAVFDTESRIPSDRLSYALNTQLPEDIRIMSSEEVAPDFHPRYRDSVKTYEYHIDNGRFPDPVRRLYTHFVPAKLDTEAMRKAAAWLVGTHDFASFCASGSQAKTTVRTVREINIFSESDEVLIQAKGEGFLYNMVRIIAGTLIKVGLGVYPPDHVKEILEAKDRGKAGETAPAKGLLLKNIEYEKID